MAEIVRHCPDCGWDRRFEQHHGSHGCPDSADWCCPEWYCLTCRGALLIGSAPAIGEPKPLAVACDRVA